MSTGGGSWTDHPGESLAVSMVKNASVGQPCRDPASGVAGVRGGRSSPMRPGGRVRRAPLRRGSPFVLGRPGHCGPLVMRLRRPTGRRSPGWSGPSSSLPSSMSTFSGLPRNGFKLVDPDGLIADAEYDMGILMREDLLELLDGDAHEPAR